MVKCAKCDNPDTATKDSRKHGVFTYRRRQCDVCDYRFNTMEFMIKKSPTKMLKEICEVFKKSQDHSTQAIEELSKIKEAMQLPDDDDKYFKQFYGKD